MESEIFDKETILDLMVNFIPLGIIFFFIAAFTVFAPWGFDVRGWGVMFAIMAIMFVALAILTYVSAKAIAGDEKRATVYAQGQAGLEGAKPIHSHDDETEPADTDDVTESDADDAAEPVASADGETDTETDADAAEPAAEKPAETDGEPVAEATESADAADDEPSKTSE